MEPKTQGRVEVCCVLSPFSCVWFFVTPWTVARQAPLTMGVSRQEYWSGLPVACPGYLPDPGIKPTSLTSPPALPGRFLTTSATWEVQWGCGCHYFLSTPIPLTMARRPREPQDLEKRGRKVPEAPSLQKYDTERLADKFTNGENCIKKHFWCIRGCGET